MDILEQIKAERDQLPHRLTLTDSEGEQTQIPTRSDAVTEIEFYDFSTFKVTLKGREKITVNGDGLERQGRGELYVAILDSDLSESDKAAAFEAVDALEADDFFQASLKLIRFVRDLDPSLSHHKAVEAAMEFVIEADGFPLGLWEARQTVLFILCGPGPSPLWS